MTLFKSSLALVVCLVYLCGIEAKELDPSDDEQWLLYLTLNPKVQPLFKVYIFDLQNPEGFLKNNEKPAFKERGPYIYRETWVRDEVEWLSDGVVQYVPKKIYRFVPKLSRPNRQTDKVTTINVPMLTTLQQMKFGPPVLKNALGSLLEVLDQKSYETLFVRHLIWGQSNNLIKLGRDVQVDSENVYPYDKFGLFVGQNFTDRGTLTMATGLTDQGHLGDAIKWKGKRGLGYWQTGTECDRVHGSDGFFFKPGTKKSDKIFLFYENFCRTIPLVFQKEIEHQGIKGYRFVPSPDFYGTPEDFPENSCYCVDGSCRGIKPGLFNVSACQYGAPIMLSNPHFLNADQSLLEDVEGLRPDPELHSSFFDIEPVTGTTLRLRAGSQLNIDVNPVKNVDAANGLRELTFPLIYFMDESNGLTDPQDIERLKRIIQKRTTADSRL